MNNCPFCNFKYIDSSELEKHLLENHFISIRSFYEFMLANEGLEDNKFPLTYLIPNAYQLPNWNTVTNQYEKKQLTSTIQSVIEDYYNEILGDRFLQMFLITDVYFNSTFLHTYDGFKKVLKELDNKDRNKIWFLDWNPGYPRVIDERNLEGIKIVTIDSRYKITNTKNSIKINSWEVRFPDIIPFDPRHHHRYNILNLSIDSRNTKRLRLKNEEDQCIKFYNNDNNSKSLFGLFDSEGNQINYKDLSEQDLTVTKLLLLRNKSFMRLICTVVSELIKNINTFSDSAFLRNTIDINLDNKKNLKVNLSWLSESVRDNFINISIL